MNSVKAYSWSLSSKFGSQFVNLLANMVLARFLSPEDFGTIGVLSIIIMVANTLTESGLGGALVRETNITNTDCATIFIFNTFVSIIVYILIYIFAFKIEVFYGVENLGWIVRCLALVFVINAWSIVPRAILSHQLRFKELSILFFISTLLSSSIAVILSIFGFGIISLIIYQISLSFFYVAGSIYLTKYTFPLRGSYKSFKKLYSFGLFTTLCNVIDSIYENMIASIFGKVMGIKITGYFSQAKKIEIASSQSLVATINSTSFPILSKYAERIPLFKNKVYQILLFIPILVFPILATIMVYSKEVIFILYGAEWIPAATYLRILIVVGFFIIIDTLFRNFIKSLGKVGSLFKFTLLKRIIACFIILLVSYMNPNLILYAYLLCSALGCICNIYIYSIEVNEPLMYVIIKTTKSVLPGFVMLFFMNLIYSLFDCLLINLTINIVLLSLFYFIIAPLYGVNVIPLLRTLLSKK